MLPYTTDVTTGRVNLGYVYEVLTRSPSSSNCSPMTQQIECPGRKEGTEGRYLPEEKQKQGQGRKADILDLPSSGVWPCVCGERRERRGAASGDDVMRESFHVSCCRVMSVLFADSTDSTRLERIKLTCEPNTMIRFGAVSVSSPTTPTEN